MRRIDLNCDMGESYGKYVSVYDAEIMPFISSCNIACGFHSGDPLTIQKTIKLALEHNVNIGAHPSFPDLQGFGRRQMKLGSEELQAAVRFQVSAVKGMTEALGGQLSHVKPHGALYNLAAKDEQTAQAIVEAVKSISGEVVIYAQPELMLEKAVLENGMKVRREVFADRRYEPDLTLRSRSFEDAVIHEKDEVLNQIKQMILENRVQTVSGAFKEINADTICLHSDTKGSAELAKDIYEFLKENDVETGNF